MKPVAVFLASMLLTLGLCTIPASAMAISHDPMAVKGDRSTSRALATRRATPAPLAEGVAATREVALTDDVSSNPLIAQASEARPYYVGPAGALADNKAEAVSDSDADDYPEDTIATVIAVGGVVVIALLLLQLMGGSRRRRVYR